VQKIDTLRNGEETGRPNLSSKRLFRKKPGAQGPSSNTDEEEMPEKGNKED